MKKIKRLSIPIISLLIILSMIISLPASVVAQTMITESIDSISMSDSTSDEADVVQGNIIGEDTSKRDEFTKHFITDAGTTIAAQYAVPVHYKDDDGEYIQYDNSLTSTQIIVPDSTTDEATKDEVSSYSLRDTEGTSQTEEVLVNKKSNSKVSHYKKSGKANLIEIERDGHVISWGYSGTNIVAAQEQEKSTEELTGNDAYLTLTNLSSTVVYENIYNNVDLEIINSTTGIKENLILKSSNAKNVFKIEYNIGDLIAESTDTHTIDLKDRSGKVVYIISAPYMKDTAGETSEALELKILSNNKGKLSVKLTADKTWLKDKSRVYPVIVDPYFWYESDYSKVSCTFIGTASADTPRGNEQSVYVGTDGVHDELRALIRVNDINSLIENKNLSIGDMIVDARLKMYVWNNGIWKTTYVGLYEASKTWHENTVTWNNFVTPEDETDGEGYNEALVDYRVINSDDMDTWVDWDITEIVKKWYDTTTNNGFVLKVVDGQSINQCIDLCSSNFDNGSNNVAGDIRPYFEITYRNNKGLDDRWTYTAINAGTAGTAYINDYSGNLVFQFGVTGTSGLKLPVNLGLTYNSCMADSTYMMSGDSAGYGWKMNLQQTVLVSSMLGVSGTTNGDYPYVYTDGDGTDHYFCNNLDTSDDAPEYVDEDGLGLELEVGSNHYIVTDKDKTKLYFDIPTNKLVKMVDSHNQIILITYASGTNRITKVTDANGKSISITYTNGFISSIEDPAGRATILTYDTEDGYLESVTNPDGTVTSFTYTTDGLLSSVTDIDETILTIGYSSKGSRGVTSVQEKDADGSAGQKVTFDRTKYNTTKMRTSGVDCVYGTTDDIVTTYQFDNWGKTVSVQSKNLLDEDLGASAYTYTTGEINADGTNIKKLNKLSSNYSLGANIENLARNHSMETVDDNNKTTEWTSNYWIANTVDFTVTPNTDLSRVLYGRNSLKIKVNSVSGDARGRVYQNIDVDYLEKGATYTLSAYVKTENIVPVSGATNYGAVVCVTPVDSDSSTSDVYAEHISRNTDESINKGFRRVSVTFEVPDNDSLTDIRIQLALRAATGTVYFDAVQLEKSNAASSYNMLENASFERLISTTRPENWTALQLTDSTAYDCISNASVDGSNSFRIRGDVSKWKNLYQIVNLGSDAKEEDTYILSGWATAHSMPIDSNGAKFRLLARVYYDDDSHKDVGDITFNDSLANVNWQYASGGFTLSDGTSAVKNPEYLKIYLVYNYQGNKAYFDNIQLIKEPVPSYTYDDEGNLTSVVANAEQKSEYDYQNGNLTYFKDPKGYECEFEYYEERKLLTKATTQLGANYSYVYDDYGNATSVEAEANNSLYLKSNVDYNYPEATEATYSVESYDQNNNKTVSVYDADTGNLKSVTDSKNNTTNFTYYQGNDLPEKISAGDQYVKYNYDGYNRLSTIEHGGTTYSFEYDSFGNNTKTKVGSHTLATYDYEDYNGYIKKMTYGNNTTANPNYVEYDYDRFGNYKTIYYNGEEVGYNFTDASGLVTRTQDLLTNREHRISYDSTGRLISKELLDLNVTGRGDKWLHSLEYNYDDNNNITHFAFADKNGSYTTTYEYGKDNLLSKIVVPDGTNDGVDFVYSYDNLGRLTRKSLGITSNGINSVYTYSSSNRGTVNGKSYTTTLLAKEETPAFGYRYEYDSNGNISKIQNGTKLSNGSYSYAVKSGHWYTYDQYNQLTGDLNYDDATVTYYTYDTNGNITSKLIRDWNIDGNFPMGVVESRSYLYSDANGWGDLLTSYNGQAITYDAIGNPLTYRDGMTMEWQNGRELAMCDYGTAYNVYKYDLDGMRTSKTIVAPGGNIKYVKYVYENGLLLQMDYAGYVFNFSYDANGSPIGFHVKSGSFIDAYYYYGVNSRGDVEALYNADGTIYARYEYDAYGKLLGITDVDGYTISSAYDIAVLNPLRYRSYVYDTETGLYYLQSRYYDPTTCRFINADVLICAEYNLSGANVFCYCNNNPIVFTDSQGFFAVTVTSIVLTYMTYEICVELFPFLAKNTISASSNVFLSAIKKWPITNELFNVAMWGGYISEDVQKAMKNKFLDSEELNLAIIKTLKTKAKSSTIRGLHGTVKFTKSYDEDLYYGIHEAHIYLTGEYCSNGMWNLSVKVVDKFDFSQLWIATKGLSLGSAANDLGYLMQNAGMLTPYYWNFTFSNIYYVGE